MQRTTTYARPADLGLVSAPALPAQPTWTLGIPRHPGWMPDYWCYTGRGSLSWTPRLLGYVRPAWGGRWQAKVRRGPSRRHRWGSDHLDALGKFPSREAAMAAVERAISGMP